MEENSRDESGRFSRGVEDGDILAAVRAHDPAATSEIAEGLRISRQGADRRLRELRNAGKVSSKKIGASLVWFMPREHGRPSTWGSPGDPGAGESDDTGARADAVGDATDGPADPPADAHGGHAAAEEDVLGAARERIEELDLAGSGTDYDRRRDAVLKMYEHLRERSGERVSKSDFRDLLDGTDVGYGGGFASLWANWVKGSGDRPNALDTLPGVELRGDGYVFEVDP